MRIIGLSKVRVFNTLTGVGMLTIKKYKNRKYYNPELSAYITSDALLQTAMLREVQVINYDGKNVTSSALLSAVAESARSRNYPVESILEFARTAA